MPSPFLSRELKTAIEGKVWVANTTTNHVLYDNTIQSIEDIYIRNKLNVAQEKEREDEDCIHLSFVIVSSIFCGIIFTAILNQMLP
jgi:hypothetical protein